MMTHILKALTSLSFRSAVLALILVAGILPGAQAGLPKCSHGCKRNKHGQGRCKWNGYVRKCRLPGQSCVCKHCRSWCPINGFSDPPPTRATPPPFGVNEDYLTDYIYDYEEGTYHHVDALPTESPKDDAPEPEPATSSESDGKSDLSPSAAPEKDVDLSACTGPKCDRVTIAEAPKPAPTKPPAHPPIPPPSRTHTAAPTSMAAAGSDA